MKRELPQYQSHKKVRAMRIAVLKFSEEDGSAEIAGFDLEDVPFRTTPGFRSKWHGSEEDLGYFVQYEDGYQSWSPTKAFEEGYTKIDECART